MILAEKSGNRTAYALGAPDRTEDGVAWHLVTSDFLFSGSEGVKAVLRQLDGPANYDAERAAWWLAEKE